MVTRCAGALARLAYRGPLSPADGRNQPPGSDDCQSESEIERCENPSRQIEEHDRVNPPRDEPELALPAAQRVLPHGERTHHPGDRFERDEADRGQVSDPETHIADLAPAHGGSDPDKRKAADDECDEREVNDEDEIGE